MNKGSTRRYRHWLLLGGLGALLLFAGSEAYAATIPVGCSVSDLKDAIEAANADSAPDTLELASNCTYTLTAVDNSSPDANGLPVLSTEITFNGNDATIERSSTEGTPAFRIMQIDKGVPVHINYLTMQNGLASYGSSGGGILNGGVLTLTSVTLSNNVVLAFQPFMGGGAIYNANGTVTIADSTLKNNQLQGGGYRVVGGGAIWSEGTLNITNSSFDANSSANGSPWPWNGGGAIYINGGTVTIDGSSFTHNTTVIGGGAITNVGDLQVTDSTFASNASAGEISFLTAGAIRTLGKLTLNHTVFTSNIGGAVFSNYQLSVMSSTFSDNTGSGIVTGNVADVTGSHFVGNTAGNGAGIVNSGTLTVRDSEFAQNTAETNGGGIYNTGKLDVAESSFQSNTAMLGGGIQNAGRLVVASSVFTGNQATRDGGGIGNSKGAVRIQLSTFTQNHAVEHGGGLASINGKNSQIKITLNQNTFENNDAKWGGGAYVVGGKFNLNNSTFAYNHAIGPKSFGGGLALTGGRIGNSTFAENVADQRGGGIWNGGASVVLNVTLYKNQAAIGGSVFNDRATITFKNAILATGTHGKNCAAGIGKVIDGGHNLDTDASCGVGTATQVKFANNGLQDNGGPTRTVGLRATSPARDAGSDAVCAAAPIKSRDQRGVKRPQGAHCDIGAFEWQP